jgi:acetyl esterase/lipase
MLIERIIFRLICSAGDRKIQKPMKIPGDIERRVNIPYGKHGKWNLLDVYFPKGTDRPLPAIINIHGGGYVYGTKDLYQYYCMNLAQRGFTVVNFNYRLVPKIKFPSPVVETNEVMEWVCSHAAEYNIDVNNIFIVVDSAGSQIASQYCAIVTNPEYAGLFGLTVPAFRLRAVAFHCGMYDRFYEIDVPLPGLLRDYFGNDPAEHCEKINVLKYINEHFPPAFVMSAANDFLLPNAQPFLEHLQEKGIESICEIYGTVAEKEIQHVFHLNILSDAAKKCNDAQCDFFKSYIKP